MIDLAPPPVLALPAIVRPAAGGLWASVDAEMARLGLERRLRQAIVAELARVAGGRDSPATVDDLAAWARTNGGPISAMSLAQRLRRVAGGIVTGPVAVVSTQLAGTAGNYSSASKTWSGINVGTLHNARVVVCVEDRTGANVSSVTLGGVSFSKQSEAKLVSRSQTASIWDGLLTTATTVSLTVVTSAAGSAAGVGAHVVVLSGGATGTPAFDAQNTATDSSVAISISTSFTVADNCVVVGCIEQDDGSSSFKAGFTAPSGIADGDWQQIDGGNGQGRIGTVAIASGGSKTVTAATSSARGRWTLAAASWK